MLGALTLTALVFLDASATEMGLLSAGTTAPAVLVAIFAGVWVDRLPRRLVMVVGDFGRALVLFAVSGLALAGRLSVEQLYVVGFIDGCFEVTFSLANRAVLPSLVPAGALVEANAKLRAGEAVGESVGPTVGGALVQFVSAPVAVLLDAMSFVASGLLLGRMAPPTSPAVALASQPVWREALEGLRTAVREPALRAFLGMTVTYGFFASFLIALFAYRVVRDLGLPPLALGLLAAGGGLGAFMGAAITNPLTRRLGVGRTITFTYLLATLFDLSLPLAGGPDWLAFLVLFGGLVLGDAFYVVHNVAALSLRQAVTPSAQMGRVNAVFLVANRALRPAGALAAGTLALAIGVQATLLLGVAGIVGAVAWLVFSPLSQIKDVSDSPR